MTFMIMRRDVCDARRVGVSNASTCLGQTSHIISLKKAHTLIRIVRPQSAERSLTEQEMVYINSKESPGSN